MKILLDARLYSDLQHGISRHTYELAKGIVQDGDINLSILVNKHSPLANDSNLTNARKIVTNIHPFSLDNQTRLSKLIGEVRPDIFHIPHFAAPVKQLCKTVITIHDLIHVKFWKNYSIIHLIYYNFFLKRALTNSSHIITDSEFSKNDLINWGNFDSSKISVIYNGIDSVKFCPVINDESQKSNPPYILYVGNYKSHKNVKTLINAFAILCQNEDFKHKLMLVGRIPKYVQELIFYYGLLKKVEVTGYLNENLLPNIYSNADIFVFPSLYEGFGFPPLEAMACGCPVISSQKASLPEVLKDNAYYVDPITPVKLAKAIDDLLKNENLKKELRHKGLSHVKIYSWDQTVKDTINIYKKVHED